MVAWGWSLKDYPNRLWSPCRFRRRRPKVLLYFKRPPRVRGGAFARRCSPCFTGCCTLRQTSTGLLWPPCSAATNVQEVTWLVKFPSKFTANSLPAPRSSPSPPLLSTFKAHNLHWTRKFHHFMLFIITTLITTSTSPLNTPLTLFVNLSSTLLLAHSLSSLLSSCNLTYLTSHLHANRLMISLTLCMSSSFLLKNLITNASISNHGTE